MPNKITIYNTEDDLGLDSQFTISLNSLASGSARQSTLLVNTLQVPAALIGLAIQTGAVAPNAGSTIEVYLIRASDGTGSPSYTTDNAGLTDAAITIRNATLLGAIQVTANANTTFYGDFDTSHCGPLGPQWGIAIKNNTGQALHSTTAKVAATYNLYCPEVQ